MSEPQQTPDHGQPQGTPAHYPPAQPQGTPGGPQPYGTPPYPVAPQPYGGPSSPAAPRPQPYGSPLAPGGSPFAANAAGGAASAPGNPLGRTAFLIAVISFAVGALVALVTPLLVVSGHFDLADALGTVVSILVLLGDVAALVLGIIALRRPEPRLLAAIAVGIAGAGVVVRVLSWASSLLWYLY